MQLLSKPDFKYLKKLLQLLTQAINVKVFAMQLLTQAINVKVFAILMKDSTVFVDTTNPSCKR